MQVLSSQPWMMLPDRLETMAQISKREHDVEALAAKVAKPLDNTRTVETRGSIAIIPVIGGIYRYANLFTEICGDTSTQVLATDITAAMENPAITHIVLKVDSPGGQAAGIAELAELIRGANKVKPVIGYVDDLAASAGYWIVSACEHIAASKTAMVGSIGAVYSFRLFDDGSEKIEIVSSVSPKKRPDITQESGRTQIQAWADKLGEIFVEDVASNRGVTRSEVLENFGQGDMLIGNDALEAGMVDEITTFEALLSALQS
jgi:ClpP class serine protease